MLLVLEQRFGDGVGKAEAALVDDLLAVFVEHQRAEHRFALAAAERAVGRDAFEHAAEHLRNHHGFELLCRLFRSRRVRGGVRRDDVGRLGHRHRAGDGEVGTHPITWISACSAPAALIACRIEMMSRGPTPSAFRPSTSFCKLTPPLESTAMRLPLLSSTEMVVRGTTLVSPPLENGSGWLTSGASLTLMVKLPCAMATVETRTSAPITITPEVSSMMTFAGWSGSTFTCSTSVSRPITPFL